MTSRWAPDVVNKDGQDQLDTKPRQIAINALNKALEPQSKSRYGWDDLYNLLAAYNYDFAKGEKEHVMGQIEQMLKLWGAGPHGKAIVTAIAKRCLEAGKTLDNMGDYIVGAEIPLGKSKITITATNPVVLWVNEYRSTHLFSRPADTASAAKAVVPARVETGPLQFETAAEQKEEPAPTRGLESQVKSTDKAWNSLFKGGRGKLENADFTFGQKPKIKTPIFMQEERQVPEVKLPKLEDERFYFNKGAAAKKPQFRTGNVEERRKPPFLGGGVDFYFTQGEAGKSETQPIERSGIVEIDLGETTGKKQAPLEAPQKGPPWVRKTEAQATTSIQLNVGDIGELSTEAQTNINTLQRIMEELNGKGNEFATYFNSKTSSEKRAWLEAFYSVVSYCTNKKTDEIDDATIKDFIINFNRYKEKVDKWTNQ
ncbi:MAG: hypothetical protein PHS02_04695 [Candidatus ainarchaeum sp.]|nr:hypothetical protein [Candidatus ainarchaeum sp.]